LDFAEVQLDVHDLDCAQLDELLSGGSGAHHEVDSGAGVTRQPRREGSGAI
jgi:hypothetical protein